MKVSPGYSHRNMKYYPFTQHEVKHISTFGAAASVAMAAATFCLGQAVSVWFGWYFAEVVSPEKLLVLRILGYGFGTIGIVCVGISAWCVFARHQEIRRIMKECGEQEA